MAGRRFERSPLRSNRFARKALPALSHASHPDVRFHHWQWRILGALMGCYVFYYTGRLAIGHAMPLMEDDLGYSKEQLGWLTAAALAAYSVGQAINGNVGDRLGARWMVAAGAIGSMLLCWLFSFMDAAIWLIAVWAANGFVQSMGWAPGGRLIAQWWPHEHRGFAFGMYMLAAASATVLVWCSSYLVLALADEQDPARWRWLFRLPTCALGAAGVLFFILVRDRPQDVGLAPLPDPVEPEGNGANCDTFRQSNWLARYATVLGNVGFLLAAAVIVFQSFARYGLLTWSAAYYADAGIPVNEALLLTLSLPVGMGLGAVAGGSMSDRWFAERRGAVVAIFLTLGAVCFLLIYLNPATLDGGRAWGIALMFLAGFFVYGAQGPLWAMCPDLVGKNSAGTAVGLMDALAYAGAAAQGPLLGAIVDSPRAYGFAGVFLLLAAIAGAGALLALVSAVTAGREPAIVPVEN
jgi:OPA family glycerol-3-phosphate transporter-like MFS transporter